MKEMKEKKEREEDVGVLCVLAYREEEGRGLGIRVKEDRGRKGGLSLERAWRAGFFGVPVSVFLEAGEVRKEKERLIFKKEAEGRGYFAVENPSFEWDVFFQVARRVFSKEGILEGLARKRDPLEQGIGSESGSVVNHSVLIVEEKGEVGRFLEERKREGLIDFSSSLRIRDSNGVKHVIIPGDVGGAVLDFLLRRAEEENERVRSNLADFLKEEERFYVFPRWEAVVPERFLEEIERGNLGEGHLRIYDEEWGLFLWESVKEDVVRRVMNDSGGLENFDDEVFYVFSKEEMLSLVRRKIEQEKKNEERIENELRMLKERKGIFERIERSFLFAEAGTGVREEKERERTKRLADVMERVLRERGYRLLREAIRGEAEGLGKIRGSKGPKGPKFH